MDNEKMSMKNMTEEEVQEIYRTLVRNAYRLSRSELSEKLHLKMSTIHGLFRRLDKAGFKMPRIAKPNMLSNETFTRELQDILEKARKEAVVKDGGGQQ